MADSPLTEPLTADLPENWTSGQIVAPHGADVGLSAQHGYNYLMQQVNTACQAINTINESFNAISGKPTAISVDIPVTGWNSDSTATYPKYYDITAPGVTASDRASVDIAPAAQSTAAVCGLCPACETLPDKIRLRAASVPAASMTANYWIEKGA